jgi:hypothetical protein
VSCTRHQAGASRSKSKACAIQGTPSQNLTTENDDESKLPESAEAEDAAPTAPAVAASVLPEASSLQLSSSKTSPLLKACPTTHPNTHIHRKNAWLAWRTRAPRASRLRHQNKCSCFYDIRTRKDAGSDQNALEQRHAVKQDSSRFRLDRAETTRNKVRDDGTHLTSVTRAEFRTPEALNLAICDIDTASRSRSSPLSRPTSSSCSPPSPRHMPRAPSSMQRCMQAAIAIAGERNQRHAGRATHQDSPGHRLRTSAN